MARSSAARNLRVVTDEQEKEEAILDFLHNADNNILACRGGGHYFPQEVPDKPNKNAGHRIVPDSGGCVEFWSICPNCGMERREVTTPHGVVGDETHYEYFPPARFAAPKGIGRRITPRESRGELHRRVLEEERGFPGKTVRFQPAVTRARASR